jgi:phosphatidylglycerol:prolipoprotein diacylglycerol transferase
MIPYFAWSEIHLLGLTIYVWGIFVALGFLVGTFAAAWFAKKQNLDRKLIVDLAFWMIIAGIVGGRLGQLFYTPELLSHPLLILMIWQGGLSFFGGLIAAGATAIAFLRFKRLPVLPYVEALAFGLPFGEMIGRIGCFLIHDHPGKETTFFLGILYPDGIVRGDHGLYLVLTSAFLAVIFLMLLRIKDRPGLFVGLFALYEGCVRFLLDFNRVTDVRYIGFTPGQFASIALAVAGGIVLWRIFKLKRIL